MLIQTSFNKDYSVY